jgi:hypothetical protein
MISRCKSPHLGGLLISERTKLGFAADFCYNGVGEVTQLGPNFAGWSGFERSKST